MERPKTHSGRRPSRAPATYKCIRDELRKVADDPRLPYICPRSILSSCIEAYLPLLDNDEAVSGELVQLSGGAAAGVGPTKVTLHPVRAIVKRRSVYIHTSTWTRYVMELCTVLARSRTHLPLYVCYTGRHHRESFLFGSAS